jgi:hypothetical protein
VLFFGLFLLEVFADGAECGDPLVAGESLLGQHHSSLAGLYLLIHSFSPHLLLVARLVKFSGWPCGVFFFPAGSLPREMPICCVALGRVDAGIVLVHLDCFGESCH